MSQTKSTEGLSALAWHIVAVYISAVLGFKNKPDVVYAPVHICETLQRQKE